MSSMEKFRIARCGLIIALASVFTPALATGVNSSIDIADGMTVEGQSTVNGRISAGDNVVVTGSLRTVNGGVSVGNRARLGNVSTVNGGIALGIAVELDGLESVNGNINVDPEATIRGDIEAVNGAIRVASGGSIGGDVENVNGTIRLMGTRIEGGVTTVSGDVWVTDGSILRGDLRIKKPGGLRFWGRSQKPKVVIGPDSQVLGDIVADREIELHISDSAEVGGVRGEVTREDSRPFSGTEPDW